MDNEQVPWAIVSPEGRRRQLSELTGPNRRDATLASFMRCCPSVPIARPEGAIRFVPHTTLDFRNTLSLTRNTEIDFMGAFQRRLQGAQHILGPFGIDCDLRRWGLKLAERGGRNAKKRAIVATARKLAVLLHHLWVSGEIYEPLHNRDRLTLPVAA
jgi:hypothetical protein